jgi:hypothetical protein
MKVDNTQYHLTIAGKILVILGILGIPFSVFSWGALSFFWNSSWFHDSFHHGLWDGFQDGWFIWPWNFFYMLPGFYFLAAVLFIVSGVGLVNEKDWAKRLVWVPAVLLLFKFPIGTALGVWIIYLLQKEKELHYPTKSPSK